MCGIKNEYVQKHLKMKYISVYVRNKTVVLTKGINTIHDIYDTMCPYSLANKS